MARTVSWDELRALAAVEATAGCAISVYVDLDPSVAPTAADAETRLNSLLDEAARSEGANGPDLSHDRRIALRDDFERIRRYFDQEFDRDGARGAAVFCSGLDAIWRPLPLVERVPDAVRVGRRLHLAPLVRLVGRGDGALVVVLGREEGRFYRLRDGRLEEVTDLSEDQPRRHDQGGWSQARFQRHVDELAADHLRRVADELDKVVHRSGPDIRVVVVAPEESWAEFQTLLSQDVRSALAGRVHGEAHPSPAELLELAAPLIEETRAADEARLLDRWRQEAGRDGRATSGWPATFEAASDSRVETLLVAVGADRAAWQCPSCGRASAEPGTCPLDGSELHAVESAVDLAVHQTLVHGGTIRVVERSRDLDPVEGIGALLRF